MIGARKASTETTGRFEAAPWPPLRLLNSYRLLVAVALLVGFLAPMEQVRFGAALPAAFYVASALYLVLALLFALLLYLRQPGAHTQALIQLYTDIIVLAFAAYASGGVASGLGVLMVVPVAGAGTLLALRHALLFAALASLFVLGGEAARQVDLGPAASDFPQAALLGVALFVSAGLAAAVARRGAQTAELAEARSRDVRQLARLNERIIQQMEAGILVVEPDGTIALANASAWQLLGNPPALDGEAIDAVAPAIAEALAEWRRGGSGPIGPVQVNGDDAEGRPLQLHVTDLGAAGTLISIEDAAFIEEQLQQLKLASLGRLTASIAHEVRNPLSAISHATQLLAESPALEPADRRFTTIILDHCERVNTIVENVLQLSRRRAVDPEPLDLADWVHRFAADYRSEHGLEPERVAVTVTAEPGMVHADGEFLRQVVANLCDNARFHGARNDGTPIRIHLRVAREGDSPLLDVIDDGLPIDPGLAAGMFEPFYSTRHGGTGLGLFLAREMCEANRARLRYRLHDGRNCFRIALRRAGDAPA